MMVKYAGLFEKSLWIFVLQDRKSTRNEEILKY